MFIHVATVPLTSHVYIQLLVIVLVIGPVLSNGHSWNHVAGTGPSNDPFGMIKSRIAVIAGNHEVGICHIQDHPDKFRVCNNPIPDHDGGNMPFKPVFHSRLRLLIKTNDDHDEGRILLSLLN